MATKKQANRTSSRPTSRSAAKTARKAARKVSKPVQTTAERASQETKTGARRVAGSAKTPTPTPTPSKRAASDAIAVLKQDHRAVERLFKRFEKAGDQAHRLKRQLVDTMIKELSRHAEIEELVFYPAVREDIDDATGDVLEALEEHHVVKLLLHELEDLPATHERFDAKVTVMIENVRHHVKEEEHELFPEVRDQMSRKRLHELADKLRAAKPRVPTRPHPSTPDEPPANILVGGAAAVLDRARTVGKQAVERLRDDAFTS